MNFTFNDPVYFMLGVLGGQLSFIFAFLLAKITKPLLLEKKGISNKEKEGITCPKCDGKKYTYTETPGLLWCLHCGHEYKNERSKPATNSSKIEENITPKRARFNFDDDGLGMGETGRKPGANKKAQ